MGSPAGFPFLLPTDGLPTPVAKITDHALRAVSRLAQQYQKVSIPALVTALAGSVQDLENALYDLLLLRWVTTATGTQLDQLGRVLGQSRDAFPDDASYSLLLQARILLNRSSGTPEELYSIFKTVLPTSTFQYQEEYTAAFAFRMFAITAAQATQLRSLLDKARPGGVRAMFEWSLTDQNNTFAFDGGTGLGFGDTGNPATGGQFAGGMDSRG